MSPRPTARSRTVEALLGVLYAGLALALVLVALAAYNKSFTDSTDVTLRTGALGNALQKGSDVQLNGVPVGRVKQIVPTDDGAELDLALDPDTAAKLAPDTVARLLPKTLFGERFVQLVPASGGGLSDGDVIEQDSSAEAVELEEVFDELLPTLRAIQPDKLAASLGELSIA
ncbi:MAG: MCE family protein, partial [Myxococcales bacterium]